MKNQKYVDILIGAGFPRRKSEEHAELLRISLENSKKKKKKVIESKDITEPFDPYVKEDKGV